MNLAKHSRVLELTAQEISKKKKEKHRTKLFIQSRMKAKKKVKGARESP